MIDLVSSEEEEEESSPASGGEQVDQVNYRNASHRGSLTYRRAYRYRTTIHHLHSPIEKENLRLRSPPSALDVMVQLKTTMWRGTYVMTVGGSFITDVAVEMREAVQLRVQHAE